MTTVYQDALEIARKYMGIAAEEYFQRRCRIAARGAAPEQVTVDHLDRIVAGVKMTAKVYMSDEKAAAFMHDLAALKGIRGREVDG